jgi:large subunit ribosomal protein L19
MVSLLNKFNEKQTKTAVTNAKKMIDFDVGDVVAVSYRITEGLKTRLQNFEGVVIAKSKKPEHYDASFVIRKISHEIGVERKFLFHSPLVEEIIFVKKGVVNRAKLYYLRDLKGKATRIKEDIKYRTKKVLEV